MVIFFFFFFFFYRSKQCARVALQRIVTTGDVAKLLDRGGGAPTRACGAQRAEQGFVEALAGRVDD